MATSIELEAAIQNKFSVKLSETQMEVIDHLYRGEDVFLSMKTGGGKSLCYQAFPLKNTAKTRVLIISPLIAIMREQVTYLRSLNLTAGFVGESDECILNGTCQYVYASPEAALNNSKWRSYWKSDESTSTFGLLVVDEAHTVINWSESVAGDEPFREWYGRIGELRSLIMKVPMLVLSATVSKATRRKIKRKLALLNCHEIVQSPNRDNVKLFVEKVKPQALDELFAWLVDDLFKMECDCPRYLIFCTTIDSCSLLYTMFKVNLPSDLHKHFQMFHSCTPDNIKEDIREDMKNANGVIRVLIATSAAGMGVNYNGVNNIIKYGPPHDMDSFVQEIGRAARDGGQGYQVLIFHGQQLSQLKVKGSQKKGQHSEMREYCVNNDTCRRQLILDKYSAKKSDIAPHLCCDICAKICECGEPDCVAHGLSFLSQLQESSVTSDNDSGASEPEMFSDSDDKTDDDD